jgi:hypothetical protein
MLDERKNTIFTRSHTNILVIIPFVVEETRHFSGVPLDE